MKKLLHILLFFASLSAFGQAQSDASLSTQSTDEIKNKTLNQARIDAFNQDVILSKSSNVPTANTQTGNYTLEETDIGKTVIMNVGSANDLTVPPNSSVAFPVGTMIVCFQNGAGTTTVQAGVGVTINNTAGDNDAPARYAPFVLHKTATDTWTLSNGLAGGGGGDVASVFGRTGAVVAVAGDYEASEVTNTPAGAIAATDVQGAIDELDTEKAALASPALTGNPTAPTQSPGDNSTRIATTAYVDAAVTAGSIPDGDKGDITTSSSGTVWTIDNLVVTPAKMSTFSSSDMRGKYTDETGTGAAYFQGGDIGTPSAGVGTNITGIPYANLTGTAPFWSLASGGTLTGANTITGSTSNTFKMVFPGLGSTHTEGAGIFLENTTAAALGAQQEAPNIVLGGYAWNSGTSANHSVKVRLRLTPVQSSSTVSGNYAIGFSINGGAYSDGVTFSSNAGTNRITSTGLSTGSTSFSLRAEDSGNVALFRVRDDGALLIGNAGSPAIIAPINNSTTTSKTGPALHFSGSSGTAAHHIFNNTSTSPGNITTWRASVANSSGNTNTLVRRADVTINNTSTYTGIFAYDYFDPTATSLTGTDPYYLVNTNANFKTVLGAATGNSTLDVDGSFAADITATSTDITLGITHHTVVVDASGAARTITLPAAASTTRRIYYIINDTGTNTVTVDGNASEVIGSAGATTYVIPAVAGNAVQIQSNGTKWLILSTL
jgi:hypothetical protein